MRNIALTFLAVWLAGCSRRVGPEFRPREMELWYWQHSYLVSPELVRASESLIDRAAHAGYTGMVLWDSNLSYIMQPGWPQRNRENLEEVIRFATARGLRVMPLAAPYGYSNDMLQSNPNWAEGQRVIGTRFRVDADGKRLLQVKSIAETVNENELPLLAFTLNVTPWRQYHARFFCRTAGFQGLAQIEISDAENRKANRLDSNLHPPADRGAAEYNYVFNSAGSNAVYIAAGAFGPHAGDIAIDHFFIEETALVYALRREGTPVRIYDPEHPATVYREGMDVDPLHDSKLFSNPRFEGDNFHDPGPVTIPGGSSLKPGQAVAVDYYAIAPVYDYEAGACLTEPGVERWVRENARMISTLVPPGSSLLLGHDEMRHMNSCASCRAKNLSPGDLLAWSFRRTVEQLRQFGSLYVWSDMFDPYQNARNHFFFVEGDLAGSWRGLPGDVTVVNWNLDRLGPSLSWFSGDDPRQPVAHRQVIAGYYDPADHDGGGAARREMARATGIPGVVGMMYTTWANDYSQMESFATGAREAWAVYRDARP